MLYRFVRSGRSYTFGPYIDPLHQHHYDFLSLNEDQDGIVSGLCVNALRSEHQAIVDIGITCDAGYKQDSRRLPPTHSLLPGCPYGAPSTEWYVSCASLTNITKVRRCRGTSYATQPYIGLLIYYRDHSCEAVGQWRWDLSIDCVSFADCCPTYIRYHIDQSQDRTSVTDIEFSPNKATERYESSWVEWPLQGEIIWWFGRLGTSIVSR